MKHVLIIALVTLPFSLSAQSRLGIRAGTRLLNMSLGTSVPGKFVALPGYEGGVVFHHISEPHLGIQLEAVYSQMTWEQRFDSVNYFRQDQYSLEIPFLTHISIGPPRQNVFINLGTTTAFLLDYQNTNQLTDASTYDVGLATLSLNTISIGISAGVGFLKKIGWGSLKIEVNATQRFNSFTNDAAFQAARPTVLSASLAYLFDISQ